MSKIYVLAGIIIINFVASFLLAGICNELAYDIVKVSLGN